MYLSLLFCSYFVVLCVFRFCSCFVILCVFRFCSCLVVIVVLCVFIFVCTSVGLPPPSESPVAVSNNNKKMKNI